MRPRRGRHRSRKPGPTAGRTEDACALRPERGPPALERAHALAGARLLGGIQPLLVGLRVVLARPGPEHQGAGQDHDPVAVLRRAAKRHGGQVGGRPPGRDVEQHAPDRARRQGEHGFRRPPPRREGRLGFRREAPDAAKPRASGSGSGGGSPSVATGSSTKLAKSNARWSSAASATSVRSSAKSSTVSSSYFSASFRAAAASTPSLPPAMSSSVRSAKASWFSSSQARISRSAGVPPPPAPFPLPPRPGGGPSRVVLRGMPGAPRCRPR
jgi:hypothetical protein